MERRLGISINSGRSSSIGLAVLTLMLAGIAWTSGPVRGADQPINPQQSTATPSPTVVGSATSTPSPSPTSTGSSTATATQTAVLTSTLTSTPTQTPTQIPTQTPTQTPTSTTTPTASPTGPPNTLLCFRVSPLATSGNLVAWLFTNSDAGVTFALSRAVVLTADSQGPFLSAGIPAPTSQNFPGSTRYSTTDGNTEPDTAYVYRLEVRNRDGVVLVSATVRTPASGTPPDTAICDPTRNEPTPTPTATLTPIVASTSTPTATRTPTPTWTWTASVTPTNTWTPTPLPANTNTPPPTETFTPTATDTPVSPTDTPSPTFTITPTFTPDIQPPTPEQNNLDTPAFQDTPPQDPPLQDPPLPDVPPQDVPADTPTPEPTFEPMMQEADTPTPTALAPEGSDSDADRVAQTPGGEESLAAAEGRLAESEESAIRAGPVGVGDFRPRLIPSSRANLFRYALFGVAGLGFLGALAFLLAGIGLIRRR